MQPTDFSQSSSIVRKDSLQCGNANSVGRLVAQASVQQWIQTELRFASGA